MERTATAIWQGSGKDGKGNLTTQSGTLLNTNYSYNDRFASGLGTNPEELLAAAHAGCFTMKLSFVLGAAGYIPEQIETTAIVTLDNGSITKSHLEVKVKASGLTESVFAPLAEDAKKNCPVSKVLNAQISIRTQLLAV